MRMRVIEVDQEVFIDWEKPSERIDWSKLMTILRNIGLDWRDRRFIQDWYIGKRV